MLIKSLMKAYVDQIQKDWKHVESAQNLPFASVKKYGKNLSDFSTPYKAFEVITIDKNSPIEARAVRPVRTPKPPKTPTKTQRRSVSFQQQSQTRGKNSWHNAHGTQNDDLQDQKVRCRICNKICKNELGLSVHLRVHFKSTAK